MKKSRHFQIHNLIIKTNLFLPELIEIENPKNLDEQNIVEVFESGSLENDFDFDNNWSTHNVRFIENKLFISIEGIAVYLIEEGKRITWKRWNNKVENRDVRTFLLTSAVAAIVAQRGNLLINGTCLTREGKSILLIGMPTTGKSTLAYSLFQNGWQLVSSEICLLDENNIVYPGLQQIKLWFNSMKALKIERKGVIKVRRNL